MKTTARVQKSENNVGPAGGDPKQAGLISQFHAMQMKSKQSSGPEERTFGREMDINNGEAGQPGATTILLQVSSTGKDTTAKQICSSARGTAADIKPVSIISRLASENYESQPTKMASFRDPQQSLKQSKSTVSDESKNVEAENPEESSSSNGLIKCMKVPTAATDSTLSQTQQEESKQDKASVVDSASSRAVELTQEKLKSEARVREKCGDRLINFRLEIIETIPLADQRDFRNQQGVPYYAQAIYLNMRKEECDKQISPTYLKDVQSTSEVKDTSRAFLVEWIIDVHRKFRLIPECLYVSVFLIDRFLSKKSIKKSELHILGVTALLIATKYEEIYPPELKDLLTVAENKFTAKEVIKMELKMLTAIQFEVAQPSAYRFLERYRKLTTVVNDDKVFFLAQYLQEIALLDASLLQYLPSEIAASALILSTKCIKGVKAWNREMETVTQMTEAYLTPIVEDLKGFILEVNPKFLTTLKYKFSKKEYEEVANITFKF